MVFVQSGSGIWLKSRLPGLLSDCSPRLCATSQYAFSKGMLGCFSKTDRMSGTILERCLLLSVPLLSMTHNRRIRLEVVAPDSAPHVPSVVATFPPADWHERETFD